MLDTVLIDPGGEFIYLNAEMRQSSLSGDHKFLYNYNERELTLEKINLDELALEKKIQYEKEGPNGLGSFITYLNINDSLSLKKLESQLTANEKKDIPPKQVGTQEEMNRHIQNFREEINFSVPVWDEVNEVFYRFSYLEKFRGDNDAFGFPIASTSKVYLTILDKDLNMLSESTVLSCTPLIHLLQMPVQVRHTTPSRY